MNNELTNVYAIIKREFKEDIEYFRLQDSRELASFLHYNAHNEMFVGTDEYYYHNVNFKNLDTGKESRIFREGSLYFFPKGNDNITPDNNMTVFKIGQGTKSIKVNENGLFVEKSDLKGNVVTQYYDAAALAEISKGGLSAGNIDYIEDYIQRMGIQPDRIIAVDKKDGNLTLSVTENGEVVRQGQIPADNSRTLYSVYYEFMKSNNYYGNNIQQTNTSGMHR